MRKMMWMVVTVMFVVSLMFGLTLDHASAEAMYGPRAIYSPFHAAAAEEAATAERTLSAFAFGVQDTVEEEKVPIEEIKKPGRAFFLSALVPGWGQIYAGARTRGFVLLGIEAAAVTYALINNADGNDWEKKYEAFADEHWIESEYKDDRENPTDASWFGYWQQWYRENALTEHLENDLTHSLPDEKDHDYYEMIGKYDQFVFGWDDVHDHLLPNDSTLAPRDSIVIWGEAGLDTAIFHPYIGNIKSANREQYMDWRYEANKAFKRAKTMVGVILFNHVISAVDAARTARNYNIKAAEQKTTIRMRLKEYEGQQVPQLVLTHRFY